MVLTCLQCQGPSLHLQCQQFVPGPPTRFMSVNGACSWTSLAFSLCEWKQTLHTGNWYSWQKQHTRTFTVCIPLPLTTLSPLKVLLEFLSLGYCRGVKNWHSMETLWLTPRGRKHVGGPQPCAGQGWYRASAPECRVYPYLPWESACELGVPGKWKGKHSFSFPLEISFFFVSHYLKWSFSAFRF